MARSADLVIKMVADADGVKRGVRSATRETSRFSRQASTTARATQGLRSAFVGAAAAAGGAAMAYLSVAQAQQAITTTQELGLATIGLSRNLGMATKEASRWAAVSRARGIDSKQLTMGFTTLSRRLDDARSGSREAVDSFKALGITQQDLRRTNGSFTKQVTMLADAFGDAEGSSTRQAAAQKLLGRGYQSLLPMFSKGAAGLREQLRWADEFGATLGGKTLDSIDAYTTAQRKTRVAVMGLQIAFAKMLLPTLTDAQGQFQDFVKVLNSNLTTEQKIRVIQQQLTRLADGLLSVVEDLMPQIAQRAGEVGVRMAGALAKGFMETGFLGKLAIGALVVRWLGGTAAIAAAGTRVGGIMAGGINTAMLASSVGQTGQMYGYQRALGGGRAASAFSGIAQGAGLAATAVKGLGIQMAVVASAITMFEAGRGAFKVWFEKPADGLLDRLDQVESKAGTVQGKIGAWFEKAPTLLDGLIPGGSVIRSIANVTGLFNLNDEAASAKSLRSALIEIRTADADRYRVLKGIIRQRLDELDATRRQRAESNRIVQNSAQGRVESFVDRARSNVFTGRDLQTAAERALDGVSRAYDRFTPQWRQSVVRVLRAQEDAIRRTWTKNGKLTREGIERIKAIQERRRNLLAGADPYGIAKGLVNSWKRANGVNERGLARMTARLKEMPPKARAAAAKTMIDYARELEKKRELPEGTVRKLRSRLTLQFGNKLWKDMAQSTSTGWNTLGSLWRSGADKAEKPMKDLATAARKHSKAVRTAITGIPGPVRTSYGRLASYANEAAAAFGSNKSVELSFFRDGGKAYRAGGTVPAMVSPGERVDYRGKSWVVPGRPEPRDSVFAQLPVGAAVMTWDGQARMALGQSRSKAIREQAPHFAQGGWVQNTPKPTLSGGSAVPTSTGQAAIDSVRAAVIEWIKKLGGPRTLQAVKKAANRIDALALPYVWGGGHGSTPAPRNGPFDCSGAISRVLQEAGWDVPTSVSGSMTSWGAPGKGAVSILANPEHVYGVFGGKAWGTSGENHGGGAGWIDSYTYRSGFTVRHMPTAGTGQAPAEGYRGGGRVLTGRVSYFNGPASTTASGIPVSRPGLALNLNPGTDSGWDNETTRGWIAKAAAGNPVYARTTIAGKTTNLPIIDLGPSGFTGRAIDVTEAGVRKLGLNPATFPTDSIGKARIFDGSGGGGQQPSQPPPPPDIKIPSGGMGVSDGKIMPGQSTYSPEKFEKQNKAIGQRVAKQAGRALTGARQIAGDARNTKIAQKAINAAKKARKLAREGKINAARKWLNKSNRWARIAQKSIPGLSVTPNAFDTGGLPPSVTALLQQPGLSWQNKRDILDMGVGLAEQTETLEDDQDVYGAIIEHEKAKRKNARKRLNEANAKLRRGGLTPKQRATWLKKRNDALADLGEASSAITSAQESIVGLTEGPSDNSQQVLEELKTISATLKQQLDEARAISSITGTEFARAAKDWMSGQMVGGTGVGNYNPVMRY